MGTVGIYGPAPRKKPSKPLLPGIYGPSLPNEPWEPRTANEDDTHLSAPFNLRSAGLTDGHVYLSAVRLLSPRALVTLLKDELGLPVELWDGTLPTGPLWVGALLTWVRCCYDRELYDYRMEALREIARNHQKTGAHLEIETIWRLGGRVALFDFLRTIY